MEILDGEVLYREWLPGPSGRGWVLGFALGMAVAAGGAVAMTRGIWLSAIGVPVVLLGVAIAATAFAFRGLSIIVDRTSLAWRFGPFSRSFTLDEVSMFREREFHFPRAGALGGWGIGKALDGMDTYEVWGANGRALDVVVKKNGVTSHYLVSTAAPDRLVVQLVRALEKRNAARAANQA